MDAGSTSSIVNFIAKLSLPSYVPFWTQLYELPDFVTALKVASTLTLNLKVWKVADPTQNFFAGQFSWKVAELVTVV